MGNAESERNSEQGAKGQEGLGAKQDEPDLDQGQRWGEVS